MFLKVINKNQHTRVLKGSLAFMQHFKLVNSWFRFLMSRTGYMTHDDLTVFSVVNHTKIEYEKKS